MSEILHGNTALIRATREYRDALYDFAEGRIPWHVVIARIRIVRQALRAATPNRAGR
jgi:hypothetical protein